MVNMADIIGIVLIVGFTVAGLYLGTVRAFAIMIGVILAFQISATSVDKGMNNFIVVFIGVTAGVTIIGFLVYGATRFQPVDSMEGVFGGALGLCAGWGIARFIYHTYFLFLPEAPFTLSIQASMISMYIYDITPIRSFLEMPAIRNLMKPKI